MSRAILVLATLATIVIGTAGCSGGTVRTATPVDPTPSRMATSSWPSSSHPQTVAPRVVKAAYLPRSVPVRLQIASIGVDSTLIDLGLRADGTMEVPERGFPAGWFTGAPTPGELGPSIIVGHVDLKGPGVFYRLHSLSPGDEVKVTRRDGTMPVFRVTRVDRFPKDEFPTGVVYGDIDHSALRLITCGGSFNSTTGHYDDNFVAFADLVTPVP